jgi:tetratricopeptide (TPR) repeat protein
VTNQARSLRTDLLLVSVAGLTALAAYATTVGYELVWDDLHVFAAHPELSSLANWREIITSTWWRDALYRPFTLLTFAFDWTVWGGSPGSFHATNVVLNSLTTIAVFVLARCWLGPVGAFGAAAIFALHPVHVEAVASVVGRAEVLVGLFGVLAALLYRWDGILAERGDWSWRRAISSLGTLGALLLGLASKESAFAIPGILLIVDWLEGRRTSESFSQRARRHWVLLAASLALAIEWLVLRTSILGDVAGDAPAAGLWGEGFVGRVLIMAPIMLQYVRLFLFPAHLSADYSPNYIAADPSLSLTGILGVLVVVLLVVVAWRVREKAPVVTFALAWIGGTVLIVANILLPTGVLIAERTMFLPSVGLALIGGWALQAALPLWPRVAVTVGAVLVVLGAARTLTRIPVWRDSASFLPKVIEDAPGSFRSFWLSGTLAYESGDTERGIALVRHSLTVYPLWLGTWRDLGRMLMDEKRWQEAADAYNAASLLEPRRVEDAARAINGYALAGQLDSARSVADRAFQIDPHQPLLLSALGTLAAQQGRTLEALTWRRQAAWQAPNDAGHWYMAAYSALEAGYCVEARSAIGRLRTLGHDESQVGGLVTRAAELGCAT